MLGRKLGMNNEEEHSQKRFSWFLKPTLDTLWCSPKELTDILQNNHTVLNPVQVA